MAHSTCKALVTTCMDFRFQTKIREYLVEQGLTDDYDLFSAAGSQKTFLDDSTKEVALTQVELSNKLHEATDVYIIAHWDCGAYGGSKTFASDEEQKDRYVTDLKAAQKTVNGRFEALIVHGVIAHLEESGNITFEKIF